ncbi:MAG: DUF89 family protein [Fibrobacter sp.]|nr:DUF89 family protein [Fibrobacter sp.]
MRTYFDCVPCFINQTLGLVKSANGTDCQAEKVLKQVLTNLASIDYSSAPPVMAQKIYRTLYQVYGERDFYYHEKQRFNTLALEVLPDIIKKIIVAEDVFTEKVKLSIAANIIDFGKNAHLTEHDVFKSLDEAITREIDQEKIQTLKNAINKADKILYLCDNTGEIVFDRLLIESMPLKKITCAVRGKPVINDATLEDAKTSGLIDIVNVIANGSDAPGTVLDDCSPEFRKAFDDADLIIAKGQGNYETLSGVENKRIIFMLLVKCSIVARDIGCPTGMFVIHDKLCN